MARTKRIYNNPHLKAPRYNLDDGQPHIIHGIPFTRRSQICMGRCPQCRDPKKEPRAIRKQNGALGSIIGTILLIAISIYYFESILLTLVFFGVLVFLFGLYGD